MGTYSAFKTSDKYEAEGIILDYGEAGKFRIRRAGGQNTQYLKRFEAATRPYKRQIKAELLDEKKARKMLAEVFAATVIINWEDVTGPDGKLLEFNYKNCVQLLLDLPDLFVEIQNASSDAALFRETIREEEAKNSPKSCSTSSSRAKSKSKS